MKTALINKYKIMNQNIEYNFFYATFNKTNR